MFPTALSLDLDLRSLAAFRILLGIYFIWDVYSRLSLGRWDLAWYTSGEDSSFLEDSDTPHLGFLHRLWFFRGSSLQQGLLFLATVLCAVGYSSGISPACSFPLWLLVTAQQNRNMHVHDGSDNFSRQLLLWSCFLPITTVWTVRKNFPHRGSVVTSSLASYGLALQIVLMYLGTVCHRTIDLYGIRGLHKSMWLPPKLDAVHYALSGSFSVRGNFINALVRKSSCLSKAMTIGAMLVETICPIACICVGPRRRLPFAIVLFALHFGLLLSMRLPHWQLLTMLTHLTVWTPSFVWNDWFPGPKEKDAKPKPLQYSPQRRPNVAQWVGQVLLLAYMVFNFAGERKWIKKFDNGDIGEALRISQYWVMFSTVDHDARFLALTAATVNGTRYDLFNYVRTRRVHAIDSVEFRTSEEYPSARWERALHTWTSSNSRKRIQRFLRASCHMLPPGTKSIEWRVKRNRILPPGSQQRFETKVERDESSISMQC